MNVPLTVLGAPVACELPADLWLREWFGLCNQVASRLHGQGLGELVAVSMLPDMRDELARLGSERGRCLRGFAPRVFVVRGGLGRVRDGVCPSCGEWFETHNGDGSCVQD